MTTINSRPRDGKVSGAQLKTKHVMAGGFNTRYLELGDCTKPTLILIHDGAFGTTAELCWGLGLGSLSRDYHLLAPELLGVGWNRQGGVLRSLALCRPNSAYR